MLGMVNFLGAFQLGDFFVFMSKNNQIYFTYVQYFTCVCAKY